MTFCVTRSHRLTSLYAVGRPGTLLAKTRDMAPTTNAPTHINPTAVRAASIARGDECECGSHTITESGYRYSLRFHCATCGHSWDSDDE